MLLRWIVNNYLRDAAEGKVREVVGGIFNPSAAPAASPGETAERSAGQRKRPPAAKVDNTPNSDLDDQPAPTAQLPAELLPCDAVFVFGSGIEAGGLVDLLTGSETSRHKHGVEHAGKLAGHEVAIVESGEGAKAAAYAVAQAIEFYQPRWIVAAGFATALTADLGRGTILLAGEALNEQGQKLAIGLKVDPVTLARGVQAGRLLSVSEVVRRPAERRRLAERYAAEEGAAEQSAALACDMETFAIAEVCQQHNVPLLSVRIITDEVDDELPREIENLLKQKTWAAKVGATAGALLNRFSAAKDLWHLREDALKASDRLAKFLKSMVSQLPR